MKKTNQTKMAKTKMTKKIKISIVISVIAILLTSAVLATLLIKTDYGLSINAPDRIVVYHNDNSDNIVFEKSSSKYSKLYKQLINAHKQPILVAFVNGSLNRDAKIISHNVAQVDYEGISIEFVYDSPQILTNNGKQHKLNGDICWYQSLVFKLSNKDKYKYNTIAIIPPSDAINFVSPHHHTITCSAYSNFNDLYNYAIKLFK